MRRRARITRGFSLLETLVALAIAGVVLSGFYQALSTGARLEARADVRAEQGFVASAILDRIGVDIPLRVGLAQNGTMRGLAWELVIGDAPPQDMRLGPVFPGELTFVAVTVQDPDGGPGLTLRAIRYAETPL